MECISQSNPIARKNHYCQGQEQISSFTPLDLPIPKCNGIKKGNRYIKQVNKVDDIYTWKSCETCFKFICDNDLIPDI